jgi:hypothetical protein
MAPGSCVERSSPEARVFIVEDDAIEAMRIDRIVALTLRQVLEDRERRSPRQSG